MRTEIRRLLVVAVLLTPLRLWAQPALSPLFVDPPPQATAGTGAMPPSRAVVTSAIVGLRLDLVFDATGSPAARLLLNAGSRQWTARLERIDRDAAGFRSWVGGIEGVDHSHVVFTERDGIVSGLINAVVATYQLRTVNAGTYLLEEVAADHFRPELEPLPGAGSDVIVDRSADAAADDGTIIDVLLLYTPNARAQAGGTAQIQALASQVISDSNTIFGRSGIVPRVRLAGTAEFALTEATVMSSDLYALTNSPEARAMRNAAAADLVQLLVVSPDQNACGIGWLLSSTGVPDFNAYSVADIACVGQYTPTHEMGHNMGSHHAPEDGAFGALFPYSYGFKDPVRGFRTVMAYACSGATCPRIPNLSNPGVAHNGGPTGTAGQHNAGSINNAAATVANWRQGGAAAPPAPTGLQSQVFGTLVYAAWNPSPSAVSYTLQVGTASGFSNVFNAPIGNITLVSGTVPPGQYFWRVIATGSGGSSPPSAEAQFTVAPTCIVPGAPHSFTHTVNGNAVTLHWSPPSAGGPVEGYVIEAGSASGLANYYNGPTGSALPGGVATVPAGVYYVRLRAQNACGISGVSNEQLITVP